jgi:hypothetical protein
MASHGAAAVLRTPLGVSALAFVLAAAPAPAIGSCHA